MSLEAGEPDSTDAASRARIRKVAGWLVIQGVLELLVALIVGVGWAMQLQQTVVGELGRFQQVAFVFMAACALLGGSVKLAAGMRNRLFQARGLGIGALWSAFFSLATCYCFPTAAVLAIYGLRVYSDPAVRKAFGEP
jgi:hypothetical protein